MTAPKVTLEDAIEHQTGIVVSCGDSVYEQAKLDYLRELAALQEYGELVKAEAVKVCGGVTESTPYYLSQMHEGIDKCAAAIKEMKLP